MAKTGAERQAAYRARQSVDSGQRRISTWISTDAALALEAMADRYGVTLRDAIEMLLLGESESQRNDKLRNNFSSKARTRRKRALPRNEASPVVPVVADRRGELPGNDTPPAVSVLGGGVLEDALLHNVFDTMAPVAAETTTETLVRNEEASETAGQPVAQTTVESELARGEQYSLEL